MANQAIERFKNEKLFPQKTADGIKVSNPKTAKFYISPKIHKPSNPGKTVINSIECHTSEISRFLDPSPACGKTNSFTYKRYQSFDQ